MSSGRAATPGGPRIGAPVSIRCGNLVIYVHDVACIDATLGALLKTQQPVQVTAAASETAGTFAGDISNLAQEVQRRIADDMGLHCGTLRDASFHLRKAGSSSSSLSKRLQQLNGSYSLWRHFSGQWAKDLLLDVDSALCSSGAIDRPGSETSSVGLSEAVSSSGEVEAATPTSGDCSVALSAATPRSTGGQEADAAAGGSNPTACVKGHKVKKAPTPPLFHFYMGEAMADAVCQADGDPDAAMVAQVNELKLQVEELEGTAQAVVVESGTRQARIEYYEAKLEGLASGSMPGSMPAVTELCAVPMQSALGRHLPKGEGAVDLGLKKFGWQREEPRGDAAEALKLALLTKFGEEQEKESRAAKKKELDLALEEEANRAFDILWASTLVERTGAMERTAARAEARHRLEAA